MRHLVSSIRAAFTGKFLRDVLKLAFGTILGRVIALAALPLVTRLYSPEDFSLLAVYLSIVSVVAVIACFRLEVAIPLADDDDDAANLLALSLLGLSLITASSLALVLAMPEALAAWIGKPEIAPYAWLIPVGIALAGTYASAQFWATRARRFGAIARTRVAQAIVGVSTMLMFGWIGLIPLGLLLGNMLNIGAGSLNLGLKAMRADQEKLRRVSPQHMKLTLRKYYRYPVFSMPEALFNIAGIQIPVLLIAAQGGSEAGFLLLAMQIMTAPMALLGGSISQVYTSHAAEKFRQGQLTTFTVSIMRRLAIIGVGPLVMIGILAPFIFPSIFGADWVRSGEIVTLMVPWMLLQFISTPVSMVMFVVGRQRTMLALTAFGAIIRITSVFMVTATGLPLVTLFAASSAVFYAICCVTFVFAAKSVTSERNLS